MLEIRPSPFLKDIDIGEEITYNIDITGELDGNLVSSHTYHVYNGTGVDVTFSMAGGSAESDGVIAFGVIGTTAGTYKLTFWVTCLEKLPDTVTPYEFTFDVFVNVV